MKIVKVIILAEMPYDRYTDESGFVHATGREFIFEDGTSILEYEDSPSLNWIPEEDGVTVIWQADEE